MKVIIPMAGRGTRLRPHTLVLPKPLLRLNGKTIIEWIVEEIKYSINQKIDEIHFIIGDFGKETEDMLLTIAERVDSKGFIHYQYEAKGTAHALYCAGNALKGEVFVAFADTIFKGKITIETEVDGMIWTMLVDHPEKYGVVKTNDRGIITDFIEKPKNFISRNAIVGLYYFKQAEKLKLEIDDIVDNDKRENNEYQLTNALETIKLKGQQLKCAELDEWLDCGNREELLATNNRLLAISNLNNFTGNSCKISEDSSIFNCSIENDTVIENSNLKNCIVFNNTVISNSTLENSIIGSNCVVKGLTGRIYLGDYSFYENI